ncbi:MAG: hypothetical protein INR65_03610 [Gluconacetobacter diazotrophicus]|nr:hypothetical protein [Gluconacetobacter diazotrophicus]
MLDKATVEPVCSVPPACRMACPGKFPLDFATIYATLMAALSARAALFPLDLAAVISLYSS